MNKLPTYTFALLALMTGNSYAEGIRGADLAIQSNEDAAVQKSLQVIVDHEQQNTIHAKSYKPNTDASKIEALKGAWTISYKLSDGTTYTDTLVIEKTVQSSSNNEFYGVGSWYLDQDKNKKLSASCSYSPYNWSSLGGDYLCYSDVQFKDGSTATFIVTLSFSGNTITGGFFGDGNNFDSALQNLALKYSPIAGSRSAMPGASPDPKAIAEDVYNANTYELMLPKVKVGNANYSIVMVYQGSGNFTLKSIDPN